MATGRSTLKIVFLDSSVLFTAVNSPSGGAAKLLSQTGYKFLASPLVLAEVERNVRAKLPPPLLERFFFLANQLHHPKISPQPELISQAKKVIALKDAVILAEAKTAQPHYLVSLDRKHFFTPTARRFIRPTKIVTPKDLL